MSKTIEILPCPFCGSPADELQWPEGGSMDRFGCSNYVGDCILCGIEATLDEWNKRAAPVVERQEPVAIVIATGGPHDKEDRTLCELQAELPPIGTKLYTSPPAPVAVDEQQALQDRHEAWMAGVENGKFPVADLVRNLEAVMAMFAPGEDKTNRTLIEARACLDKVKELNQ